jgi:hypothetical protein
MLPYRIITVKLFTGSFPGDLERLTGLERIVGTAGQVVAAAIFLLTLIWGGGQLRKKLVGVQDGLIAVLLLTISCIFLTFVVREQSRILGIYLWIMALVSGAIVVISVSTALYMARRRGEAREQLPDRPKYLFGTTIFANVAAFTTIILCTILLNRAIDAKESNPHQVSFASPHTEFTLPSVDAPHVEVTISGRLSWEHRVSGNSGRMELEIQSADGRPLSPIAGTEIPAGSAGVTGERPIVTRTFKVAVPDARRAPGLSLEYRAVFWTCIYLPDVRPMPNCRFSGTATVRGIH